MMNVASLEDLDHVSTFAIRLFSHFIVFVLVVTFCNSNGIEIKRYMICTNYAGLLLCSRIS